MLRRNLPLACLATLLIAVVSPAAADSPSTWLEAPVQDAYASVPWEEAESGPESVDEAIGGGAYLSALVFMGERVAQARSEAMWEEAQQEPDPRVAFLEAIRDALEQMESDQNDTAARLAQRTGGEVAENQAEPLLVAAHLLVDAEASQLLGWRYLAGIAAPDGGDVSTPLQRYTMVRFLALADLLHDATKDVLASVPESSSGKTLDAAALRQAVEDAGGPGEGWVLGDGGPLQALARHVHLYERQIATDHPNITVDQLADAVAGLDAAHRGMPGPGAAWVGAVHLDAAWWLARAQQEYQPETWDILLREVHASAVGAHHEAILLGSSEAGGEEGLLHEARQAIQEPGLWAWVAVAAGVVVVSAAVVLARRMRRGGRRPLTMLLVVAVVLLMLAGPGLPGTAAVPLPADPTEVPVLIEDDPEQESWGVDLALDDNGVAHFVWYGCSESNVTQMCMDIDYRSYDTINDAWSPVTTLVDSPAAAAIQPRIHHAGGELHLFWVETEDPWYNSDTPAVLWHCPLSGTQCADTSALSDPAVQASYADVATGPDGRMRVAWHEETPEGSFARLREQSDDGWGPTVSFPSGSTEQRMVALDVDGEGRSHVAWRERPAWWPYDYRTRRAIAYGFVDPGAQEAEIGPEISHSVVRAFTNVDIAVVDGTIHAGYAAEGEMYHREKPLDEDAWSSPTNVSRTDNPFGEGNRIGVHGTGSSVALTWLTGGVDTSRYLIAERGPDGVWKRPRELVGAPYDGNILFPVPLRDGQDRLHIAWAGTEPGAESTELQPHYRILAEDAFPYAPPEVASVFPSDGAWVRTQAVSLRASVLTDAPIDTAGTQWRLDGQELEFSLDSEGVLRASTAALDEGAHEVEIQVRDERGGTGQSEWSFNVDRTPPTLTGSLVDDGGIPAEGDGWWDRPLFVEAQADGGDGAAAWVEIQFDDGYYSPVEDGFVLPEGQIRKVRLRGVDAAGNVDLGGPVRVGWDATPPDITVTDPAAWWMSSDVSLALAENGASDGDGHDDSDDHSHDGHDHEVAADHVPGSPVHIQAQLEPLDGSPALSGNALLSDGSVTLRDVPDGRYRLMVGAWDEAGNRQDPPPGPWEIGVDTLPPTISLEHGAGGHVIRAHEDGSGLAVLRLETGGALVLEEPGEGAPELEVPVPTGLAGGTRIHLRVEDVLGHVETKVLVLPAGGEQAPELVDLELDDVDQTAPPDDRRGVPASVLVVPAGLMMALGLCRRGR